MAETPHVTAHAVYLKQKHGWFWVVPRGQMSTYYGPYGSQHAAEQYHEDIDTYRSDRGGDE